MISNNNMKNKCKKCDWEWRPRVDDVKLCPHCKSYKWNEQEEKNQEEVF